MASFLDTQPIQYNQPVQTASLDAITRVGIQKQQLYDEGVQRVQGLVDQTAALPVMRDVDKSYLNQSLSNLQSTLQKNTSLDFSQLQVQNSVAGMSNKIAKDKYIQAAVLSTTNHQSQLLARDQYQKDGKTSVANDYDYQDELGKYLNSKELGQTFTYKYNPYTDVKKKALDAIKSLHPNLAQFDQPFVESNGKIDYKSIANAMKRYKVEGITEGQIEAAISANLGPDDFNQLRIDGKYQFRGVSPDQLVQNIQYNLASSKRNASDQIDYLNKQRTLAISNPEKLNEIDARLAYYKKQMGGDGVKGDLDTQAEQNAQLAISNPEQAKANLYKNGFISQFANAFKWKQEESTYEKNPLKEQENWVRKFNQDALQSDRTYKLEEKKFDLNARKLDLEIFDKAWEHAGKPIIPLGGSGDSYDGVTIGNPTTQNLEALKMLGEHVNEVAGDMSSIREQMKAAGLNNNQVNEAISDYKQNGNKSTKVPSSMLSSVQEYLKKENYLNSIKDLEEQKQKEADQKVGISDIKKKELIGKPTIDLNVGGEHVHLSPAEVLGVIQAEKVGSTGGGGFERTIDKSKLNPNQLKFISSIQDRYGIKNQYSKDFELGSYVNNIFSQYNESEKKLAEASEKAKEIYTNSLAPLITTFIPRLKAIPPSNDGSPNPIQLNRLSDLVTAGDVQSLAADSDYDPKKISEFLTSKINKDTRFSIKSAGDQYEVWVKNENDPKNIQKIRLTPNQVSSIFGSSFLNKDSQETIRTNLGKGNTNLNSDPTKSLLQVQFGDFPYISKMQVTADLQKDLSNPNLYIPIINVKTKDGHYASFEISGQDRLRRLGYEQGKQQLSSLTDDQLVALIKQSYPGYDLSKLDIK